jgi:putative PIN family toxin of toxin-antitoxin system
MIRAVLDANVFVSAVITATGNAARILDAWRAGRIDLVVSPEILSEVERVLNYPKIARRHRLSAERIRGFIEDLARLSILTPGEIRMSVIQEDPSDDRYLECALEGEADCIVSGDQHLLETGEYRGIRILTPKAFLAVLKEQTKD